MCPRAGRMRLGEGDGVALDMRAIGLSMRLGGDGLGRGKLAQGQGGSRSAEASAGMVDGCVGLPAHEERAKLVLGVPGIGPSLGASRGQMVMSRVKRDLQWNEATSCRRGRRRYLIDSA